MLSFGVFGAREAKV
jgi:predicted 3-demethylubiquinone-9 3-methyltransferase (glyoxalase superfamily)